MYDQRCSVRWSQSNCNRPVCFNRGAVQHIPIPAAAAGKSEQTGTVPSVQGSSLTLGDVSRVRAALLGPQVVFGDVKGA